MNIELEDLIHKLEQDSSTQIVGAVKSLPLVELLKNGRLIQDILENKKNNIPYEKSELARIHNKLQDVITKRLEVAQKLIAKFSETSPEIIALNTSIFSLVPSRDVLEDVKAAHGLSEQQLRQLTKASSNILEAVNIEIQQRFYDLSPETIAVHYSGDTLESYRKLLKSLLPHIEAGSDIFKVYSTIIRNIIKGSWIYESKVSIARSLCQEIFQTHPPDFGGVFSQYSLEELETSANAIRETLKILEQDITGRPSIHEFAKQCRQTLETLSRYFLVHKMHMRKSTRILQLSHHINSSLSIENVSENAITTLMICLELFEETYQFLLKQQEHLDVVLNLESLEEAQQKVQEALRYRQFSIVQLLQDISILTPDDLVLISGKYLDNSNLLLREMQHLVEEYLHQILSPPQQPLLDLEKLLQDNIEKLHKAMSIRPSSPNNGSQSFEVNSSLPSLSRFYDKELIRLIHKALNIKTSPADNGESADLETSYPIPVDHLRDFIESFVQVINVQKAQP